MKLFTIPAPYDYHKEATFCIMAESIEQVEEIMKLYVSQNPNSRMVQYIELSAISEHDGPIYIDEGCDC